MVKKSFQKPSVIPRLQLPIFSGTIIFFCCQTWFAFFCLGMAQTLDWVKGHYSLLYHGGKKENDGKKKFSKTIGYSTTTITYFFRYNNYDNREDLTLLNGKKKYS